MGGEGDKYEEIDDLDTVGGKKRGRRKEGRRIECLLVKLKLAIFNIILSTL